MTKYKVTIRDFSPCERVKFNYPNMNLDSWIDIQYYNQTFVATKSTDKIYYLEETNKKLPELAFCKIVEIDPREELKVDDKVIVKHEYGPEEYRHFSHYEKDKEGIYCFDNGMTSFTTINSIYVLTSKWSKWRKAERIN